MFVSSLGLLDFARSGYLVFSEIAKPLHETTARSGKDPPEEPKQESLQGDKETLTSAPALGAARCDMGL